MAEKLARMHGTEEDKVNCPFYFKIGACRYGDKCLRIHNKPPYSQTIVIRSMYKNLPVELALASGNLVSEEDAAAALKHFEDFYEEVFMELANYGEIDDLIVCDNVGEHLLGAVYIKFVREDEAIKCVEATRNRYYDGQILVPEYSPVTDFSNAKCKQFIDGQCKRGGYCNYMHLKPVSSKFKRNLFKQMYEEHPEFKKRRGSRSKSRKKDKKSKKSKKHRSSRSRDRGDRGDRGERGDRGDRGDNQDRSRSRDKKSKRRSSRSKSRQSIRSEMNSEERREIICNWLDQDGVGIGIENQLKADVQLGGLDLAQLQAQQALTIGSAPITSEISQLVKFPTRPAQAQPDQEQDQFQPPY